MPVPSLAGVVRDKYVRTNETEGLSDPAVREEFERKLALMYASG